MFPQKFIVDVTTDSGGAATVFTDQVVRGPVHSIAYVKDGSVPFTDGVSVAWTAEDSLQSLWSEASVNASKTVAPRQATHTTAGAAALYAAGGAAVLDKIFVTGERLKLVVASGGAAKKGRFIVVAG